MEFYGSWSSPGLYVSSNSKARIQGILASEVEQKLIIEGSAHSSRHEVKAKNLAIILE